MQKDSKLIAIKLEPGQPIYRLLVVEDRAESRLLLVKLLTRLGFEVQTANNGLEGINIWREWQPHLILMDMRMPVMNGHEATKQIKATTQGQATVVVALTASALEEECSIVLSEGCDAFVRKPFRQEEIVEVLTKYLGVRFVFEQSDDRTSRTTTQPSSGLSFEGMTADWIASLRQAAMGADSNQIIILADQIHGQKPALALALTVMANNFDHDAILDAIKGGAK